MTDFAALTRELDALEAVQAALARIAERTDDGRRQDLIQLRRQLAFQVARVGTVAEPIFGTAEPSLAQEYRNRFSRMRSAMALHQANWPAVRLEGTLQQYQASALSVNEANRVFVAWMRSALEQLPNNR